jgi:HD-GYP domain-containing protein (c-di-GMP phosphodiesterase class II)
MTPKRRLVQRAEQLREIGCAGALERWARSVQRPSPSDTAAAIVDALDLDACVIFQRRIDNHTSVGYSVRHPRMQDALSRAYIEHVLVPDESQGVVSARTWARKANVPSYLSRLFDRTHWILAVPILDAGKPVGAVWLLGDRKREQPPRPSLRKRVAEIALAALHDALGLAIGPESEEIRLLEDLGTALTGQQPLARRLENVVQRVAMVSGFASVQMITASREGVITATFTQDIGLVQEPVQLAQRLLAWGREHFASRPGPLLIPSPEHLDGLIDYQRAWMRDNHVQVIFIIPLLFGSELLGVFQVCSQFSEEDTWRRLRLFTALGTNVAAVLKSVLLVEEVDEARREAYLSHRNAVRALANAAEARDAFTGGHLVKMEAYVRAIGARLGWTPERIDGLAMGAICHDVGKLTTPDRILLKPGRLDEEERAVMREHPLTGEEILRSSNVPVIARKVARWHHERWDGDGYPDRLKGETIPLEARIVSVADAYDAITSIRPYKPAWSMERAVTELLACRASQFDPDIVDCFVELCWDGSIARLAGEAQNAAFITSTLRAAA